MSGNRYPTPEEKKKFVSNLKGFLDDVNQQGGWEYLYNSDEKKEEFKKFFKREDTQVSDNPIHDLYQDFHTIQYWLADLDENLMTQFHSDPIWGYNEEGKFYIKDWKSTSTVRGEVHHWYGPMRKSKKQRKSRKNTRKSRKNTRNNRKRRT